MAESEIMASSPSKPWSETRNGRITVAAGVVSLFVLVFWMGMKSRRILVEPAALEVPAEYLDFGDAWERENFTWSVRIDNPNELDVEVADFVTSCTCASVEPSSLVIPAKSTRKVTLKLNLTLGFTEERSSAWRNFYADVTPVIKGDVFHPIRWRVHGRVRKVFFFDPSVVHFEDSLVRGRAFEPQTVGIACHAPIRKVTVLADPAYLDASVLRVGEKNKGRFEIRLKPKPSLPAGFFETEVLVKAVGGDGKVLPPAKLAVDGRVVETIQCVPPTVVFGVCRVGEVRSKLVVLQSIDGEQFTVTGFQLPPEGNVAVEPAEGRECSSVVKFCVKVTVLGKGNNQNEFRFFLRTKGGREIVENVKLFCFGIP